MTLPFIGWNMIFYSFVSLFSYYIKLHFIISFMFDCWLPCVVITMIMIVHTCKCVDMTVEPITNQNSHIRWWFCYSLQTGNEFDKSSLHFLCLWFRASLIYINNCPTRFKTKQSIYCSASSLYMLRVSTTPIIRGTQNSNYSLRYWSCFCAATSLQRDQDSLATLEGGSCSSYSSS